MTFALDPVWPPMFVSRTCDASDPCFVGARGGEQNRSHAPSENSVITLSKIASAPGRYLPPEQRRMQGAAKQ